MYFSVKKLIHHPRKRLYNLIKTCNIKKKEGEKRKKNVGAMPASKRRNLTTKSSSWERLGPRISCVWWNFPENGHRISPFVANHVHSRPDSGSLTYLRSHFSTSRLTYFRQERYTPWKKIYRMGIHFHDEVSSIAMLKFRFIFEETSTVEMNVKIRQRLARVFCHIFAYKFFLFFLFITWNK